jgi:hypothetical protein
VRFGSWIGGLFLAMAIVLPGVARAEDACDPNAVTFALQRTDSRIALAHDLLIESPNAEAQTAFDAAQSLQVRARGYFDSQQYCIAYKATLAARDQADRAVSLIRNLPDPERVQQQVERTRDILDRAHDRLGACDNARARALLSVSLAMQEKAETAVDDSRYLAALQLTLGARERVTRAMKMCNIEESMADASSRALQRTDEVISRALERVDGSTPDLVRDLVSRAQTVQAQAKAEAQLAHHEAALRLTLNARMLAQRALRTTRATRAPAAH